MKKLVSLTLALVMIVTCLAGISFAADPIAKVETNGKVVEVATMEELLAAIDESGKSVVTLLKDVSTDAANTVPYTCTLDLNGHKLSTTASNAWIINAAGTEYAVSTIKNGTIDGAMSAIQWRAGGLIVDGCTLIGRGSTAIQILNHADADPNAAAHKDINIIKNSTLQSTAWHVLSFNSKEKDFTAVNLTLENSTFVAHTKNYLISSQSGATFGSINFGKGVEFYTQGTAYKAKGLTQETGEAVTQAAGVHSVTVNGVTLDGLNKFVTPEYVAPVVPETPATPAVPETPATPAQPATPSVPTTGTPDVTVPATGVSVVALGVMAMVSLAGAVITKKH